MADNAISETVKVFCRQRLEHNESPLSILPSGICKYSTAKTEQCFNFNECFDCHASQEQVFSSVALPLINSVIRGYSGAILAYGCTSSGKTYTMRGIDAAESKGIMPRCYYISIITFPMIVKCM
jgi:hypothetical protein